MITVNDILLWISNLGLTPTEFGQKIHLMKRMMNTLSECKQFIWFHFIIIKLSVHTSCWLEGVTHHSTKMDSKSDIGIARMRHLIKRSWWKAVCALIDVLMAFDRVNEGLYLGVLLPYLCVAPPNKRRWISVSYLDFSMLIVFWGVFCFFWNQNIAVIFFKSSIRS